MLWLRRVFRLPADESNIGLVSSLRISMSFMSIAWLAGADHRQSARSHPVGSNDLSLAVSRAFLSTHYAPLESFHTRRIATLLDRRPALLII